MARTVAVKSKKLAAEANFARRVIPISGEYRPSREPALATEIPSVRPKPIFALVGSVLRVLQIR
jgi:hypothetical protein